MKIRMCEIKNVMDRVIGRLDIAEEYFIELENRAVGTI